MSNMNAESLLHERHQLDAESFVELRVWRVPTRVRASGHRYKYSLAYVERGVCVLRYDNEAGKGDHIHRVGAQSRYKFTSLEKLLSDFWSDVDRRRAR
jgi:hypothetical protein